MNDPGSLVYRPRCSCGEIASKVVPDWRGGWILLCDPHWRFLYDERIRIELPAARLELAESLADADAEGGILDENW